MNEQPNEEQVMDATPTEARRLVRRREGKMVAGVAAGLADYFGADAVWFRLGFVVFSLLGGSGIVAYLVLWAVMPDHTGARPAAPEIQAERLARWFKGTPTWIGAVLLGLGGLLVLTSIVDWRPGVFWGLALVVLGILFFRQQNTPVVEPISAPPGTPGGNVAYGPPPLPSVAAPSSPRPKRERSRLGWFTIGVLMLAQGAAAALDLGDVFEITLSQYLALALAVIGAGLLTGAWVGRARWLVVPGVLLVPFVLTASLITVPFAGGWGEQYVRPTSVQSIEPVYRVAGGSLLLDLQDLQLGPAAISIRATTAVGRIQILVPPNTPLQVRARVGAGQADLFGRTYEGLRIDVTRTFNAGPAPGRRPVLLLDLETSLGQVQIMFSEEPVGVQS